MREELQKKVNKSIERLRAFEPAEGYYLAFSGGKDSCVCKALLDMAGCKYDAHYRVIGADPPQLVRFIKEHHPDVEFEFPRDKNGKIINMWTQIPYHKIPPTRLVRYCCQDLKEGGGDGRMLITGVRWAESTNRKNNQGEVTIMSKILAKTLVDNPSFTQNKKGGVILSNDNEESRRLIEQCYVRHKTSVNPIIDWEDRDVWDFIKGNNIPYCELYDQGFDRIGCIGCPMARLKQRKRDFAQFPKVKNAYLIAFQKMLDARKAAGLGSKVNWETAEDVFRWWIEDDVLPGQTSLFEGEEE